MQELRNPGTHGRGDPRDPRESEHLEGPPPKQVQPWPGSESAMRPQADHGEHTYRGAGKLAGLHALISGGDSGIGRAVAIAFAREGADVAIAYLNEHADAQETLAWVHKEKRRGISFAGDLGNADHCRRVVEDSASALGGLNLLVNNAALHFEQCDFTAISPSQLEMTFRANVFSAFWLTR